MVSYYLIHTKCPALIEHIHQATTNEKKHFPLPMNINYIGDGEYLCLVSHKLKLFLDLKSFPRESYWIKTINDPMYRI